MTPKHFGLETSPIGEARNAVLREIQARVVAKLADQLDRVIFMALCLQFGGPYFSWDDLRGRCERRSRRGRPDVYLLDGRPILEISFDEPLRPYEPIALYGAPHEIRSGFSYRIIPKDDS